MSHLQSAVHVLCPCGSLLLSPLNLPSLWFSDVQTFITAATIQMEQEGESDSEEHRRRNWKRVNWGDGHGEISKDGEQRTEERWGKSISKVDDCKEHF